MIQPRRMFLAVMISLVLMSCGVFSQATAPTAPPPTTASTGINADWQGITFTFSASIGTQWLSKTVPADPADSGAPENWRVAAHEEFTFPDYPVKNQYQPARILVFAVSDWQNYNPEAVKRVPALQQLITSKPTTVDDIPVLPVFNAAQVFRAHISYLSFNNGSGVRFVTQYDQAPIPINNKELFYSFQGLTTDGKYEVSAFFPITHSSLPADDSNAGTVVGGDFKSYLDKTIKTLDATADDSFTPPLSAIDKVIQSLKVK